MRFPVHVHAALRRHAIKIYPGPRLPRGVISVHVRRSDKINEAVLRNDSEFLMAAEAMVSSETCCKGRQIFLSTEDSLTVEAFQSSSFTVTHTVVPRFHRSNVRVVDGAVARGIDMELADSMISLKYALQCDAFIGDLSSNWVRLIDELRSTIRCKAHVPFVDPSQPVIRELYW